MPWTNSPRPPKTGLPEQTMFASCTNMKNNAVVAL